MTVKPSRVKKSSPKLNQKLLQREAEYRQAGKIQEALYEIADAASAVTDMQSFYKKMHEIVGELMYAGNFFIATYDERSGLLSFPYCVDEVDSTPAPQPLSDFHGMTSWIIRTGYMGKRGWDQSNELVAKGEIEMVGTPNEDGMIAPLKAGGNVIGVVAVQSYTKGIGYTDEDERVLEFVAQHIAIALTRARAIDETRQRNSELQIINSIQEGLATKLDMQGIYDLVGDKIREIFDANTVTLATFDLDEKIMRPHYAIEKGRRFFIEPYPIPEVWMDFIRRGQPTLINSGIAEYVHGFDPDLKPRAGEMPKSVVAVPLIMNGELRGVVSLQNIDRENAFNESDLRLLQTLANSMGVALENARLFAETQRLLKETEQRASELQIINSVQQGLVTRLDVQSIYDLVGDRIRDIFQAQVVMISTYDKQTETIEHRYAIERGERIYAPGHHPIRGFRIQVVETRQPVLVGTRVAELAAQLGQPTLPGTITPKTWLGVPLIVEDQVTGILSLQDIEHENAFGESVVRLLQTLAASMSVALENARLWEQEHLYRKALEREFEIGREIQAGFLPDVLPQPKDWEIAASLKSAREVAGDFYDVFELPGDKIGLVIADVCDKGLGAALFMTLFRSLIRAVSNVDFFARTQANGPDSSALRLKNAISLTNNYIAETHGDTGMFATIFFGILDTRTGVLTYINGGHLPPMLVNTHGVKEFLRYTGSAVGAMADTDYVIKEARIEQGESFFAYTDGLTDTVNPEGGFFSEKELIPLLMEGRPLSPLLAEFQKRVADHAAGGKQFDDITMLAARRLYTD